MVDRELTTLLEGGGFFEGPRWHDGLWWVSDFYRGVVMTVAPDGSTEQVMAVEQQPSGFGWMPDGSLLVASMKDRRVLRRSPSGVVSVHAEIRVLLRRACERHGGGLAGTRVRRRVRVRPSGLCRPGAGQPDAHRSRRLDHGAGGRSHVPQRGGHHTRRRHADRRGDRGRALYRVCARRRRHGER